MLSQLIKKKPAAEAQPGLGTYLHDFFMHSAVHIGALAELFAVEASEYSTLLRRRVLLLCIGGAAMAVAYFSLWAILVMLMWENWCGYGALAVLTGFHFLVALIFIIAGWMTKPGRLAPMTVEELKSDLTCIKLSLSENDKP